MNHLTIVSTPYHEGDDRYEDKPTSWGLNTTEGRCVVAAALALLNEGHQHLSVYSAFRRQNDFIAELLQDEAETYGLDVPPTVQFSKTPTVPEEPTICLISSTYCQDTTMPEIKEIIELFILRLHVVFRQAEDTKLFWFGHVSSLENSTISGLQFMAELSARTYHLSKTIDIGQWSRELSVILDG